MARNMFFNAPLRAIRNFAGGKITNAMLQQLVDNINDALTAAEKAE